MRCAYTATLKQHSSSLHRFQPGTVLRAAGSSFYFTLLGLDWLPLVVSRSSGWRTTSQWLPGYISRQAFRSNTGCSFLLRELAPEVRYSRASGPPVGGHKGLLHPVTCLPLQKGSRVLVLSKDNILSFFSMTFTLPWVQFITCPCLYGFKQSDPIDYLL